jgi:hypothetical protein
LTHSKLALLSLVSLIGCDAERLGAPDDPAGDEGRAGIVCNPLMSVFPVDADHNIGYDSASCGTGTCATSCPDQHANSDWGGAHHGIDVFAHHRAPLVAVADGEVVAVGTPSSTSGLRVRLRDACGWEYYYGHLDQATVTVGQWLSAGDLLGYMGLTGTSSTHLHFNVSPDGNYSSDIDPFPYLSGTSATACSSSGGGGGGTVSGPPMPSGCGAIGPNQGLPANTSVSSCDGRFQLAMQGDGNLVLYTNGWPLWDSGTHGHPGSVLWMQGDGNMVVYDPSGWPLWSSGTAGFPGATAAVQSDGNFVVYIGGWPLWDSGTCCL